MVVVFGLLLPILAMMYFDILETKQETKRQQEVMQRLINKTKEEDEWGKNPSYGNQKRFGWEDHLCFVAFIVFLRCLSYVGVV